MPKQFRSCGWASLQNKQHLLTEDSLGVIEEPITLLSHKLWGFKTNNATLTSMDRALISAPGQKNVSFGVVATTSAMFPYPVVEVRVIKRILEDQVVKEI